MISFKNYLKEFARGLPDFFTVGYALKEKRETEAKGEIRKKSFMDSSCMGVDYNNIDIIIGRRKGKVPPILEKTPAFCERYGLNLEEFVEKTILESARNDEYRKFFKEELTKLTKKNINS